MRMPPEDSSPLTLHVEYGQYHLARLRADPKLKDLVPSWGKVQDRLKAGLNAVEQAHGATPWPSATGKTRPSTRRCAPSRTRSSVS